ncbi:MAG: hypothetical protein AAGF93_01520 [Cyanobacteria bacterium P01_H01_bin.105]
MDNDKSSSNDKLDVRKHDIVRRLAVVDYIIYGLLRLSKKGGLKYGSFSPREIGALLFNIPYGEGNKATGQGNDFLWEERKNTGLNKTIGYVVDRLSWLLKRHVDKDAYKIFKENGEEVKRYPAPLPTKKQIFQVLQLATQLAPEELKQLGLPAHSQHPLLQRAIAELATYEGDHWHERFLKVYKAAISWKRNDNDNQDNWIVERKDIRSYIDAFFGSDDRTDKDKETIACTDEEKIVLKKKIKNAVDRLLLQAGTGQARFLSVSDQENYIKNYIRKPFLDQLIQTIIYNNRLSQDFPVYLKHITIEPVGAFPISDATTEPKQGVFHEHLLKAAHEKGIQTDVDDIFQHLLSRSVFRVVSHFYIRLEEKDIEIDDEYQGFSKDAYKRLRAKNGDTIKEHFKVSSTGIGGTNSHILKTLNSAVLSDLDCLRGEYFPIAHDIFIDQEIISNLAPSPVWSHNYVYLCHNKTLSQAMKESCQERKFSSYEDFRFYSPEGQGNYYGFDSLLSSAKSNLQARLDAIRSTRVEPDTYILDLRKRVEQHDVFNRAINLVTSYPFSSFAFESSLKADFLDKIFEKSKEFKLVVFRPIPKDKKREDKDIIKKHVPQEGTSSIFVANISGSDTYYVSIFNKLGRIVVDTEEGEFLPNQELLDDLKQASIKTPSDEAKKVIVEKIIEETNYYSHYPFIFYKGCLEIAKTFLDEGAYRKAYPYLKLVKDALIQIANQGIIWLGRYRSSVNSNNDVDVQDGEQLPRNEFPIFSGALIAFYEICLAQYLYVLDWQAELTKQKHEYFLDLIENVNDITQREIVKQCWLALDRAEEHLTVRIAKYHMIDEVSQAAFHPHYKLLAQIYFLRARLFMWFPTRVAPASAEYFPPTNISTCAGERHIHGGRLFLNERARVYAACDGDNELYVICTVHQAWTWLLFGMLSNHNFSIPISVRDRDREIIEHKDALSWARQLRDHALLNYREIGQHCYQAIKEKSGLSEKLADKHSKFNRYKINPIPTIRETVDEEPGYRRKNEAPQDSFSKEGCSEEDDSESSEPSNQESQDQSSGILYLDMSYMALLRRYVDPDNSDSAETIYLFGPKACYLFFIRGLYHLCSKDKNEFYNSNDDDDEKGPVTNIEEWDSKLQHCYNLFSYAWASADDGCDIRQIADDDNNHKWVIERYLKDEDTSCEDIGEGRVKPPNPHAESVWYLYPHRIAEIADLGKVFAATCAILRLYTSDNHQKLLEEIDWLLKRLPISGGCEFPDDLKKALSDQERYNGHLLSYLEECNKSISNACEKFTQQKEKIGFQSFLKLKGKLLEEILKLDAVINKKT